MMKKLTSRVTLIAVLALITLTVSFADWRAQAARGAGFISGLSAQLSTQLSTKLLGRKAAGKNAAAAPVKVAPAAPMFATFTVTNTNDSGAGSLRQAITDANANAGADVIDFNLGAGTPTIAVMSGLPDITDPVTINGNTGGATRVELNGAAAGANVNGLTIRAGNTTIVGLVINRFKGTSDTSGNGILILESGGNTIRNCYIGTDATGTVALGNTFDGMRLNMAPNNTIGGITAGERNVISGNGRLGVYIINNTGATAIGSKVIGNYIGRNATDTADLGNGSSGVSIEGAANNIIGGTSAAERNVISGNGNNGVTIFGGAPTSGNVILGNSIVNNTNLGIDVALPGGVNLNDTGDGDTGANNLQNFPVLTCMTNAGGVTTIGGTLNSLATTAFRIEYFLNDTCDASGNGEGKTLLSTQNVTTNGSGNVALTLTVPPIAVGKFITATATRLDGSGNPVETSEFSPCLAITAPPTLAISDVTLAEGNAGTTNFVFTVTLTGAQNWCSPVTVAYATTGGTATAGSDYTTTSGTLTFAPPHPSNTVTQTITVPVTGDTAVEQNEAFFVNLSSPTNATITDNQGLGTITNDDTCPTQFIVNSIGDAADATPGDSVCATTGGVCTLRAAIMEANAIGATCSPLTINITATGVINLMTALDNLNHPNLTITGPGASQLDVHRNAASQFRIFTVNNGRTVNLSGLTVSNGEHPSQAGGILNSGGTLTMTDCVVSGNRAPQGGGLQNDGTLIMNGCTVSGNVANGSFGGGLIVYGTSTTLTNCTFSGNNASQIGGGVSCQATGLLHMTNCTVTNNTADGLHIATNAVNATLKNTIIAGNSTPSGTARNVLTLVGFQTGSTNNLLGAGDSGGLTNGVNGNQLNVANALLAPLANYGGTTPTHALLPGSPALNVGDNASAPTTDQRGIARPQQSTVDIGAYESRGFTLALNGGTPQSTFINNAFATPLKVNVTPNAAGEPVDGGQVTFTPPVSGAGATLTTSPATIANGMASVTATANATTGGPYNVVASAPGVTTPVNFALTNNVLPTIAINDVTLAEGNSGTTAFTFTVSLSAASGLTTTVSAASANGTATTADSDYAALAATTITFAPGDTSKTVTVNVNGDLNVEANETFFVNLTSPTNATISDAQGLGTINNDDTCPLTLIVKNAGDAPDAAPGNGVCATVGGVCTLRAAIEEANARTDCANVIEFDLGMGTPTIMPLSPLPEITDPVTINGNTGGATRVELNGSALTSAAGLVIRAGNSTIEGLVINRFGGSGIFITTNGGNTIRNSYIGTDATGTMALGNGQHGIHITSANNIIGGATVADRNVISGNNLQGIFTEGAGNGNRVIGNYIGVDATGTVALGNGRNGVYFTTANNIIGGTTVGERNVISANATRGVWFDGAAATGNQVLGNYIGIDATGTANLGNGAHGVQTGNGASNNLVGGTGNGAGNLIAYNAWGVLIDGANDTGNVILGNSIFNNFSKGIGLTGSNSPIPNDAGDADTGANGLQNFPVLTCMTNAGGVTTINGTLNSLATTAFRIEYFLNDTCDGSGNGEGKTLISTQTVTTDASGNAALTLSVLPPIAVGKVITATATRLDALGNPVETSEFSKCLLITGPPTLSIADKTIVEGNAGVTNFVFTVTLTGAQNWCSPVTVNYATADGTATAGSDYTATSGTLTFAPPHASNSVTQTITVPVTGDTVFEPNETFFVNLNGATNATISDAQGQGTINNDEAQPTIAINDVTLAEGNAGTTAFTFTVNLSRPSYQTITVSAASANGTATVADSDYAALAATTITFTPGDISKTVTVNVTGDMKFETNETFFVNLSSPTNATIADNQGLGTITNDDAQPTIAINDVTRTEGNSGTTAFTFTVSLSAASGVTTTVNAASANGTATLTDSDYAALAATTITFNPGETSKTVTVNVNGDVMVEGNETFFVNLTTPTNATILDAQGVGTITNDDVPPFTASMSDPFVCNGIGSSILVTAQLTNPNATAQAGTFNVTLPSMLTLVPGTCTSTIGACTPTPNTQVAWSGNIPAGQSVTFTYQAQIADGTPDDTLITINSTGSVAGVTATVSVFDTVSCPAANLNNDPVNVALSDQKAGSVLVFPYYTSKASTKADTRLSITNVGTQQAYAHIFLLDGATCQQADYSVCITPNGSFNFKASEVDPETTGWVLVVVTDAQGRPMQNNTLVGNAFLKDGFYVGNYGAEAFWANSAQVATLNANNTATLRFDDTGYDAVPNQFAVEVQSPRDVVGQKVVTVGMNGDLNEAQLTGAGQVGAGLVYNANENPFGSFVGFLTGNCQATAIITPTNPRLPTTMGGIVPSGQAGTIKFKIGGGVGLLLTPQNSTKWSGIRGLHKTATTFTTITIPLATPIC